ncbi:MAG: Zinc ABC transporter, ATP-binding protein ZnuC, partial [uncultured Pseudonocardia sp.]
GRRPRPPAPGAAHRRGVAAGRGRPVRGADAVGGARPGRRPRRVHRRARPQRIGQDHARARAAGPAAAHGGGGPRRRCRTAPGRPHHRLRPAAEGDRRRPAAARARPRRPRPRRPPPRAGAARPARAPP